MTERSWKVRTGALLKSMALGAAAIGVVGFLYALSGLYNIGASAGHKPPTTWFLEFGMRRAVATQSLGAPKPPPLDDPALIRLGAAHYHGSCAACHAFPGGRASPVALSLLPKPPRLDEAAEHLSDRELFFIVKHGIKYAAMPAFPSQEADDEVWAVVAFLKKLPTLDEENYRTLAFGAAPRQDLDAARFVGEGAGIQATAACARCHGDENAPPASALTPALGGQPAAYLEEALRRYASGARKSGMMRVVAAELEHDDMRALAEYYASMRQPMAEIGSAKGDIERGRVLVERGDVSLGVAACHACHGDEALERYPRLHGLHPRFIAARLERWKRGEAETDGPGAIMAPIAARLSEDDISAIEAFYAAEARE